MANLPRLISVVEVGPRDGLQSFERALSTDDKVRMIDRLSQAGLGTIEVTGFAHPIKIPQFADADEVCARIARRQGTVYRALVPNERGAIRAVAAGIDALVGLVTVSEAYLAKNQNMSLTRALDEAVAAFKIADGAGKPFTMAVGLAFWCPYEGLIADEKSLAVLSHLHAAGVRKFYLAATVGLEDPMHVRRLFGRAYDAFAGIELGFHVHNLAGRASALTLAAVESGAQWVEGSICGIGGGIAMPATMAATGNYATEDLVAFLADTGVNPGIDPDEIVRASLDIASILGITPRSFAGNGATRPAVQALVSKQGNASEF